jgi:hypothetical protein
LLLHFMPILSPFIWLWEHKHSQQSQVMRKSVKLRPDLYRYSPNAKLHVGQRAQLFEFPQHVAILVLQPNACTLKACVHSRACTHTHTHTHTHTQRNRWLLYLYSKANSSFDWHTQCREECRRDWGKASWEGLSDLVWNLSVNGPLSPERVRGRLI